MDLIPAVAANPGFKDLRSRGIIYHDRDIPGRVEEGELGGVEEGGASPGAVAAEYTTTLPTVLTEYRTQ